MIRYRCEVIKSPTRFEKICTWIVAKCINCKEKYLATLLQCSIKQKTGSENIKEKVKQNEVFVDNNPIEKKSLRDNKTSEMGLNSNK